MNFAFEGGAALDPPARKASPISSPACSTRVRPISIRNLPAKASELAMKIRSVPTGIPSRVRFQTLSRNRDEAFKLLKLRDHFARFMMSRWSACVANSWSAPGSISNSRIRLRPCLDEARPFGDHPYGRESDGTPESLTKITTQDLRDLIRRVFSPAKAC